MSQKKEKSMATPPLKWSGKNTYNNDVYVDFEKKTVSFNPVKITGAHYLFSLFMFNMMLNCFLLGIIFIYTPLYVIMQISYQDYELQTIAIIITSTTLIIGLIYGLLYFKNKYFQEWIFPKLNAMMLGLLTRIFSFGMIKRKKTMLVNPEAIQNRMIIIPHFANVELCWDANGEFAKYLSSIDVRHIYLNSEWSFYAIFRFKKNPKKGFMSIQYS